MCDDECDYDQDDAVGQLAFSFSLLLLSVLISVPCPRINVEDNGTAWCDFVILILITKRISESENKMEIVLFARHTANERHWCVRACDYFLVFALVQFGNEDQFSHRRENKG